eukprot:1187436-Alexandrium_andersonii.AAC.1
MTLSTTVRMHGITACAVCDDVDHATCQLSLAPLHSAPMQLFTVHRCAPTRSALNCLLMCASCAIDVSLHPAYGLPAGFRERTCCYAAL